MKLVWQFILSTCTGLLLIISQSYAVEPVSTGYWNNTAIGGHDSLGYYEQGITGSSPTKLGDEAHTVIWKGAEWRFSSQTSADKFAANPTKFAPRYNGHCANALSLGEGLIPTSGEVWEFFGDHLHLFYAERGRQRWLNGDWKSYQITADAAWEKALK